MALNSKTAAPRCRISSSRLIKLHLLTPEVTEFGYNTLTSGFMEELAEGREGKEGDMCPEAAADSDFAQGIWSKLRLYSKAFYSLRKCT